MCEDGAAQLQTSSSGLSLLFVWFFSTAICKKDLHFLVLYRQNTFKVDKTLMVSSYRSFIESILTFCFILWYGDSSVHNKNHRPNNVIIACKIIGVQQLSLHSIYDRQILEGRHPQSNLGPLWPSTLTIRT